MAAIITNLSTSLIKDIKVADEIWIAVALLSSDGLSFLMDNLKQDCKQNYVVGVDLPTDPKALKKLNELQFKIGINVRIYAEKTYFHPKLYLTKSNGKYSAFVGSANCTNGGLHKNVELTTHTTDQKTGSQLLNWFEGYFMMGRPLTTAFIKKYQTEYAKRVERKRKEEQSAKKGKQVLNQEYEATLSEKNLFYKILRYYRRKVDYNAVVTERKNSVNTLRKDLDYPHFHKLQIDSYFGQWALGHLIPIAIPAVKRNLPQLKKLLEYLKNETVDISIRIDRTLTGNLKTEGVSIAFITKFLAIHKPDLYFVKNKKTELALRKYGLLLPRGLTAGEKYKIMCIFLRQVCKETNIKNLTVLDYYLYLEGNKE
jgi:hypothetical protein